MDIFTTHNKTTHIWSVLHSHPLAFTHTHIPTHTHTYIYTHTHTCIHTLNCLICTRVFLILKLRSF